MANKKLKEFNKQYQITGTFDANNRNEIAEFLRTYELHRWTQDSLGLIHSGYKPSIATMYYTTKISHDCEEITITPTE